MEDAISKFMEVMEAARMSLVRVLLPRCPYPYCIEEHRHDVPLEDCWQCLVLSTRAIHGCGSLLAASHACGVCQWNRLQPGRRLRTETGTSVQRRQTGVYSTHSQYWFFFTLECRIWLHLKGRCMHSYTNLKNLSQTMRKRGSIVYGTYQYITEYSWMGFVILVYTGIYRYIQVYICIHRHTPIWPFSSRYSTFQSNLNSRWSIILYHQLVVQDTGL